MNLYKTLNSGVPGLVAHIYYDPDPESPAEWDNLGTITYNDRARTVLGIVPATAERDAEIARKVRDGEYIGLPVWAYVHSGSTVKAALMNPFGCPWDSGRSGWVYVERDKAVKEFGRKLISKKLRIRIQDVLRGEVETFNQWLQGDVYGIVIERDGEEIDSVWGCYGSKYAEDEAQEQLRYYAKKEQPMEQLELPLEAA